jgi:hypothetical protein
MATRLQLTQEGRLKLLKARINQYDMRFPVAEIHEKLGTDMGNISNMLKGKKPISDNFWTSFNEAFPDKGGISDNSMILETSNVKITLQDYIDKQEQRIDELKKDKELLYQILNSTLMKINNDQQIAIAYHKAWVELEAEKASEGNEKKKKEIMYKMGKLVDGKLQSDSSMGTPGGTGM